MEWNDETGLAIRMYLDKDMCAEARAFRYSEFVALVNMPFRSKRQARRLIVLRGHRIRDNRWAIELQQMIDNVKD